MKRKIIFIILVFALNILWVNAISATNSLANHYNFVIKINKATSMNNHNILDDLDVMLENNLTYNDEDAVTIGGKMNNYLHADLSGYGEMIAKYSIANSLDPYLVAAMIIESSDCEKECSVLVTQCHNVGKLVYHENSLGEMSCFGGYYQKFNSIDDSIKNYIKYIKVNFYDKELTTPGTIYKSYKKDVRWVFRINQYIEYMKTAQPL